MNFLVVICFQFWILRSLITTDRIISWPSLCCDLLSILDITIFDYNTLPSSHRPQPLWFAFNSGYYDLWLQQMITKKTMTYSCDLLSILDITIFDYNNENEREIRWLVVICFQFWILRSLITTHLLFYFSKSLLWFAFNSGYYDLWLQRIFLCNGGSVCCDLLSILDITIFDYNSGGKIYVFLTVVICFQFWILRSLITT